MKFFNVLVTNWLSNWQANSGSRAVNPNILHKSGSQIREPGHWVRAHLGLRLKTAMTMKPVREYRSAELKIKVEVKLADLPPCCKKHSSLK